MRVYERRVYGLQSAGMGLFHKRLLRVESEMIGLLSIRDIEN